MADGWLIVHFRNLLFVDSLGVVPKYFWEFLFVSSDASGGGCIWQHFSDPPQYVPLFSCWISNGHVCAGVDQ